MIIKIIKNWYFENIYRDESKNILYVNAYFYLSLEKLIVSHMSIYNFDD
jgi:hypothetical protein